MESKICIDIICKELDKQGIEYYTIHDAWLVDSKDIKKTESIIIEKFYKHLYRRPELKIEKRESYRNRTKTRGGPPNDC